MVNGNLYLVITLVVLRCYYLSPNVRRLSLDSLSSDAKQGWICSHKRKVARLSFLILSFKFRINNSNSGFNPGQVCRRTIVTWKLYSVMCQKQLARLKQRHVFPL